MNLTQKSDKLRWDLGYLGKLGEIRVWILMENDTDMVMSSHLMEVILCKLFYLSSY